MGVGVFVCVCVCVWGGGDGVCVCGGGGEGGIALPSTTLAPSFIPFRLVTFPLPKLSRDPNCRPQTTLKKCRSPLKFPSGLNCSSRLVSSVTVFG